MMSDFFIPEQVQVFEISGPLFFGATYKFKEAMKVFEKRPEVLILRMGKVPMIDATGLQMIRELSGEFHSRRAKIILSEVNSPQIIEELRKTRLLFYIGKANVTSSFEMAIKRSQIILNENRS